MGWGVIPEPLPGFGIWGMFVGQVGLGLSVIVSLTIGIVVDDTIHFLSKYLRGRREKKLPSDEAVRFALIPSALPCGLRLWLW
jgi:predicted RND superfamily exporter protein